MDAEILSYWYAVVMSLIARLGVRIVKNFDRGLKNTVRGRRQHFQTRGHSFSLYGPTLIWSITKLQGWYYGKRANFAVVPALQSIWFYNT